MTGRIVTPNPRTGRPINRFNEDELRYLKKSYARERMPGSERRTEIAKHITNMRKKRSMCTVQGPCRCVVSEVQIKYWFDHGRRKERSKKAQKAMPCCAVAPEDAAPRQEQPPAIASASPAGVSPSTPSLAANGAEAPGVPARPASPEEMRDAIQQTFYHWNLIRGLQELQKWTNKMQTAGRWQLPKGTEAGAAGSKPADQQTFLLGPGDFVKNRFEQLPCAFEVTEGQVVAYLYAQPGASEPYMATKLPVASWIAPETRFAGKDAELRAVTPCKVKVCAAGPREGQGAGGVQAGPPSSSAPSASAPSAAAPTPPLPSPVPATAATVAAAPPPPLPSPAPATAATVAAAPVPVAPAPPAPAAAPSVAENGGGVPEGGAAAPLPEAQPEAPKQ